MVDDIKRRLGILAIVVAAALVFLWPTVNVYYQKYKGVEVTPEAINESNWPSKPIALGLDLSGGVYLDYRVVTDEAVKSRLVSVIQGLRSGLRKEKVPVIKTKVDLEPSGKFVASVTLLSDRTLEKAKSVIDAARSELVFEETTTDSGKPVLRYSAPAALVQQIRNSSVEQAKETLDARVNQFGVAEPLITRAGVDRIILQMPGAKDIEAVKKVVGRVAKLEFRLVPQAGEGENDTVTLTNREGGGSIKLADTVLMDGSSVRDARVGFDSNGQIEVSVMFTQEGGRQFAQVTGENVGRQMAIILDGEVYSTPVIRERIAGGVCSITGGFDIKEAGDLGLVLRAGALPAPLEIQKERTVGPSLGLESIKKGTSSILIGFALILAFMAIYYRKSGVVASVILLVNLVLILACLSMVGATLTLPGLAGLALTIGMAVDSNVIIFERIRDELKTGASRNAAVEAGFDRAYSAIMDSNITTLLTGIILYYFGTGAIRGFAVTLSIGILTTVFCAIFVTKICFDLFPLTSRSKELSI
jgi:preprotein translocase subunit SecD